MSKSHKALCLFCLSLFLIWALIPAQAESSGTGLHIYFLDVGQGDAAVILCDGEAMIIKGFVNLIKCRKMRVGVSVGVCVGV